MRFLARSLLPLILLLAVATNAWSADGRILSFEGDVQVNGQQITANTLLQNEDKIVTAAGASVRIVLSDNSVLDIESDSEIQLSDYSYTPSEPENNKSEISVVEGSLRYVSGLIAKEDPDDIGFKAGNATIGVRGSFTGIEVKGKIVNVEAMIGEATFQREADGGKKDTIIVPTGKTTLTDPTTGEVLVAPSTAPNKINTVVQAIAAASPDARTGSTDKGCSRGKNPLRATAIPAVDTETADAIATQLAELDEGEVMMVIAVLINNARHLCIDSSAIAAVIGVIAQVNPDALSDALFIADLIDNDNRDEYENAAGTSSRRPRANINQEDEDFETDIPPGGTGDPSPE